MEINYEAKEWNVEIERRVRNGNKCISILSSREKTANVNGNKSNHHGCQR
jgi:hypothetical protein